MQISIYNIIRCYTTFKQKSLTAKMFVQNIFGSKAVFLSEVGAVQKVL